jgi:hypothetical protein
MRGVNRRAEDAETLAEGVTRLRLLRAEPRGRGEDDRASLSRCRANPFRDPPRRPAFHGGFESAAEAVPRP